MAEFKVETNQLQNYASQISALQRELDSVAVRLGAMQLGSVLQIKASTALIGKVADCKWAAAHQSDNLGRLATGLSEIAELYNNCEKNLSEPKTQAQADAQGSSGSGANDPDTIWDHMPGWAKVIDWFGKKCAPVAVISSLINFSRGDASGVVSGFKALASAAGPIAKAVFNTGGGWSGRLKDLFGFSAQGVTGLKDSWNSWLKSMNLNEQTTTAGKVGTIAKWAGYALTVAGNAVENYGEYQEGGMSTGRLVGETVIESAVDIGLSIGAGVLVAAALPATAPAIVVGAAAAGVVWVANEVCEWVTDGRDIGEVISDAVCDGVEAVSNAAREVGDAIADGASAAWNGICNWAGGLFA